MSDRNAHILWLSLIIMYSMHIKCKQFNNWLKLGGQLFDQIKYSPLIALKKHDLSLSCVSIAFHCYMYCLQCVSNILVMGNQKSECHK